MIAVRRGDEPPELKAVRERELSRIFSLAEERPPTVKDIGDAYRVARERLWESQHMKCCYCEQVIPLEVQPVEHIRPKTKANREPGAGLKEGYWWLAWTWENLLFACHACNTKKSINWPLSTGAVLQRGEQPPGKELPFFVDPSREDPLAAIQFVCVGDKWGPIEIDGGERGKKTLSILGFSSAQHSIRTLYKKHVKDHIEPAARRIREAHAREDEAAVGSEWAAAVEVLVLPTQLFSALGRAALPLLVGEAIIERWGLELPPHQPPRVPAPPAAPVSSSME